MMLSVNVKATPSTLARSHQTGRLQAKDEAHLTPAVNNFVMMRRCKCVSTAETSWSWACPW